MSALKRLSGSSRRGALLALACSLFTCAEENERPITQVIVVVAGDPRIESLSISLQSENGRNVSDAQRMVLAKRQDGAHLPTSFTLVPPVDNMGETTRFRLVVTGEQPTSSGTVPLVRNIAVAPFSPGKTTLLSMVLSRSCALETCGCSFMQDTCADTCLPPGINTLAGCRAVPVYARLAEVEPGQELTQLQQGAGGCAPGEELSATAICTDLDECEYGFHECDREPFACVNEVSGAARYRCQCPTGTRGNGIGPDGCR